jgi:hypothetical protein
MGLWDFFLFVHVPGVVVLVVVPVHVFLLRDR